jgi:hypothetical protein
MRNNYSAAVNATDNILFEWPRTFNKRTLAITQLTELVIAPEEESAVIKASQSVPFSRTQIIQT